MKTNHKLLISKTLFQVLRQARALFGLNDRLIARRRGITYSLDLTQGIDLYIFLFGEFEVRTAAALRRIVRPGHCVLDIGANVGAHTLALAKLVGPNGKVFAFEPTAFAFQKLTTTLSLNPDLSRVVTATQAFLGPSDAAVAPASIYSSWPLVRQDELNPTHGGEAKATVGATVLTLDGYCKAARVDRVDVIKLDVDGYECDVLNGGREMIGRCKPVFVMEFAPSALQERGESLDALLACLLPFGYRFYGLDGNPLPDNASALRLLIREGESINVIANVSGGSAAQ